MNDNKRRTILVVGDWVVDEYWFLVGHHSDISSHIGLQQHRLSSKPEDVVRDLCGAGHVARVLYHLREENSPVLYDVVGLGAWDKGDTNLISHLFHDCDLSKTKYRFRLEACDNPPDVKLISLDSSRGTTRVIRLYVERGRRQLERIDWAKDPDETLTASDEAGITIEERLPGDITNPVVVICDHQKGVIDSRTISALQKQYGRVDWYVRSKRYVTKKEEWKRGESDWLTDEEIKLVLIGPEVAARHNPIGNWLSNGKITHQALETLESIGARSVVLVSDEHHVIARLGDMCVTGEPLTRRTDEESPQNQAGQVGWTSAVFASLIHTTYDKSDVGVGDIKKAIEIVTRGEWKFWVPGRGSSRLTENTPAPIILEHRWGEDRSWSQEKSEWEQALRELPFITEDDTRSLEVWRASTDLPGYIACIEEKRAIIRDIGTRLRAYSDGLRLRPLSILLTADPGAGKTSLARSLAKAFRFKYLGCDLTQFGNREKLLDFFDSVVAQQSAGENVLVFVDEVNTPLNGGAWYSSFLTPLEEGSYGRRQRLAPAVWIFAGTNLNLHDRAEVNKFPDFRARMTVTKQLDYQFLRSKAQKDHQQQTFDDQCRLEQMYLGATMIKYFHPGVEWVETQVLERFFRMDPSASPAREIRKLASLLRNVQFGRVTQENWGENWNVFIEEYGEAARSWQPESQLVHLIF
jgi:hypothetical protein